MRIDQFLPSFVSHDAIGNHTLQVRKVLRSAGYESDIYAEAIGPGLRKEARPWVEAQLKGPDVALYHASTDSAMAAGLAESAAGGDALYVYYHNITPSSYFARWLPAAARGMDIARRQLEELAPSVGLAMAASSYSEGELKELGYRQTATCHLLVDLDDYHRPPDPRSLARLHRQRDGGGARWLFVGRLAPNKCQHDVIAAFAIYRRVMDPKAHLTLVGGGTAPRYLSALRRLVVDLELGDSVAILDTIEFPVLLAEYAAADVFVCLSEHEGFCVPIIEAMELSVPVVAYAAAAVSETVGAAGALLADKDPLRVAIEVEALLGDQGRRTAAIEAGRAQARTFALERTSAALLATIRASLAGRPGAAAVSGL